MRRLRAGIAGAGIIGLELACAIRRLGYVDIVAIAGTSYALARVGAKGYKSSASTSPKKDFFLHQIKM